MKKGIKKDNYFERNRIIQQTQKYRYNFIDYLYYQGERYNKRYIRSSGNQLITLYWIGFVFLPLLPFCTPHYTDIQGDILEKVNLIENLHPIVEIVIFLFPIFVAITLPPNLWCLLRYKKRQGDGHQASLPTKYMEGCDSHMAVVDDSFFISPVIICNL